jgi:hypothetical protein
MSENTTMDADPRLKTRAYHKCLTMNSTHSVA